MSSSADSIAINIGAIEATGSSHMEDMLKLYGSWSFVGDGSDKKFTKTIGKVHVTITPMTPRHRLTEENAKSMDAFMIFYTKKKLVDGSHWNDVFESAKLCRENETGFVLVGEVDSTKNKMSGEAFKNQLEADFVVEVNKASHKAGISSAADAAMAAGLRKKGIQQSNCCIMM